MNEQDRQIQDSEETPLQGWKEISSYMERDPRTCQRWQALGLPVRRYGGKTGSVYAYPSEIEQWRASRPTRSVDHEPESTQSSQLFFRWIGLGSTGALAVAAGAAILLGPVMNPPSPLVQASEDSIRTELVWPEARGVSPQGDVSPDGKVVTFVDWRDGGNLAVRDLESGEGRRLTNAADWGDNFAGESRVSPDGETVVYSWFRTDAPGEFGTDLMLVPLDGGLPTTLRKAVNGSSLIVQDWLPSGDAIAAVLYQGDYRRRESARVLTISIPGGEMEQIRTIDWADRRLGVQVRASPDGSRLAYSRLPSRSARQLDVFVVAADGSSEVPVVVHEADDALVGWSSDGSHLLFRSDRDGGPGLWAQQIGEAGPVGEPFVLVADLDVGAGMGMTRDGSLHYAVRVSRRRLKIADLDLETGKLRGLPQNVTEQFVGRNFGPLLSPDGSKLAYWSERNDTGAYRTAASLIIRDVETGEEKVMENSPELGFGRLASAPDGERLWSVANSKGTELIVDEVDVGGGRVRRLGRTSDQFDRVLRSVAAPGANLIYCLTRDLGLYAFNLADQVPRKLLPEFGLNGDAAFSISPDGRLATAIDEQSIRVHPLNGGQSRILAATNERENFGRWTVWAPDGSALLVLKRDPSAGAEMWRLMIVRADGSGMIPSELVYEPANAGARPLTIHPDGRRIVYDSGGYFNQFWALHNLPVESDRARPEE